MSGPMTLPEWITAARTALNQAKTAARKMFAGAGYTLTSTERAALRTSALELRLAAEHANELARVLLAVAAGNDARRPLVRLGPGGSYTTDLTADIREGHLSSAMCHMGNVSHVLGKTHSKQELDAAAGKNPHTKEAWQRMHAHLVANGVDVDTKAGGVRMGPRLTMDPASERFDDEAANRLLTRAYRDGFAVPTDV